MNDIPEVECIDCQRHVRCIRVKDGTIYRPMAWTYPDEATPLRGVCHDCHLRAKAKAYMDRLRNCTAEEYEAIKLELGLR